MSETREATPDVERAREARRGRRASWVALALAAPAVGATCVFLDDWRPADRYRQLREHVERAERFAIERHLASSLARAENVMLLVTIDGVAPGRPVPPEWTGSDTLDSLLAAGAELRLLESVAEAESLALAMARAARERGELAIAIPGRMDGLDAGALASAFDDVALDRPRVTGYLDEGASSWVTLEAIRALERAPDRAAFLWLRYAENLPPRVLHRRFRVGRAWNESVAIDHYLGRLMGYVREVGASPGAAPGAPARRQAPSSSVAVMLLFVR